MRHAKREHGSRLSELQRTLHTQPTLQEVLFKRTEKYTRGSQRKEQLDEALVTLIARDMQPLSLVEDKGFQDFCEVMDRRYQVPGRVHLRNSLLPEKFDKVQGELKIKLGLASSVSVSTDLWTSVNNSGFMAMTCHWWDEGDEKLRSAVLDCHRVHGRHTAEMIQEEAERVLQAFGIRDKVLAFITDNASNIRKAIKTMDIRRFSCYAHVLNLVVVDSFKEMKELQEVRDKVSRVVKLTRQSTVAKEKLDSIQKSLGKSPKKLIQDCPTRWNSLYEMFQRFAELKDAVSLLLIDLLLGSLSSTDWEVIQLAIKLLGPCYEATVELSGEKMSTGSKAIPMTKMLMTFYAGAERDATEGSLTQKLAHHLLFNLNSRMNAFEEIRILALACLLDPRFKNRCFRHLEKKKAAISILNKEVKEIYEKEQQGEQQQVIYFNELSFQNTLD